MSIKLAELENVLSVTRVCLKGAKGREKMLFGVNRCWYKQNRMDCLYLFFNLGYFWHLSFLNDHMKKAFAGLCFKNTTNHEYFGFECSFQHSVFRGSNPHPPSSWILRAITKSIIFKFMLVFLNMGHPRRLFPLFFVFSNKHYNF